MESKLWRFANFEKVKGHSRETTFQLTRTYLSTIWMSQNSSTFASTPVPPSSRLKSELSVTACIFHALNFWPPIWRSGFEFICEFDRSCFRVCCCKKECYKCTFLVFPPPHENSAYRLQMNVWLLFPDDEMRAWLIRSRVEFDILKKRVWFHVTSLPREREREGFLKSLPLGDLGQIYEVGGVVETFWTVKGHCRKTYFQTTRTYLLKTCSSQNSSTSISPLLC